MGIEYAVINRKIILSNFVNLFKNIKFPKNQYTVYLVISIYITRFNVYGH
jgi:hypothetical protein